MPRLNKGLSKPRGNLNLGRMTPKRRSRFLPIKYNDTVRAVPAAHQAAKTLTRSEQARGVTVADKQQQKAALEVLLESHGFTK